MKLTTILPALMLSSLLAAPTLAQNAGVTVGELNVEGGVIGQHFTLDEAFSQEHGREIPAPFEFVAPTGSGHRNYVVPATGSGIIKAFFLTPDDQIMSNIQFMPIFIDAGEPAQRLDFARPLLKQIFERHIPEGAQSAVDGVQITNVGPYPAIEAIGHFDSGEDGILVIRVVAIPRPDSEEGIAVVILASVDVLKIEDVSEIYSTLASLALTTFRYR